MDYICCRSEQLLNSRKPGVLTLGLQDSYGSVDLILLHLELPDSKRAPYNVVDKAIQFLPVRTPLYLSFSGTRYFCSCCCNFSLIDLLPIITEFQIFDPFECSCFCIFSHTLVAFSYPARVFISWCPSSIDYFIIVAFKVSQRETHRNFFKCMGL